MIKAREPDPKALRRLLPKADPIQKATRLAVARQAAQDVKDMGELGKPFLLALHSDMEKAVEEIRILWGMKSRAQAIRHLVGRGLASM